MQRFDFADHGQLLQALLPELRQQLRAAVTARGHAYLVVSGGSTPRRLFAALAESPLPWAQITVLLADERWLPADHADSNEGLVKRTLLQGQAAAAQFISLLPADALASNQLSAAVAALEPQLAALPTFDVVLLGMGDDGHTASLHPGSAGLAAALLPSSQTGPAVVALQPVQAPYARISLTAARLLNSRQIYLQLIGARKAEVLAQALGGDDPLQLPIRRFLQQTKVPLSIYWAAQELAVDGQQGGSS